MKRYTEEEMIDLAEYVEDVGLDHVVKMLRQAAADQGTIHVLAKALRESLNAMEEDAVDIDSMRGSSRDIQRLYVDKDLRDEIIFARNLLNLLGEIE